MGKKNKRNQFSDPNKIKNLEKQNIKSNIETLLKYQMLGLVNIAPDLFFFILLGSKEFIFIEKIMGAFMIIEILNLISIFSIDEKNLKSEKFNLLVLFFSIFKFILAILFLNFEFEISNEESKKIKKMFLFLNIFIFNLLFSKELFKSTKSLLIKFFYFTLIPISALFFVFAFSFNLISFEFCLQILSFIAVSSADFNNEGSKQFKILSSIIFFVNTFFLLGCLRIYLLLNCSRII